MLKNLPSFELQTYENPYQHLVRFPYELVRLAQLRNAYLSLFDRRVVWVKGRTSPLVFDLDAPVIVNGKITRIYIHGTRVCGIDSNGWLTRSYTIPTNSKPSQDGDFSQLEGDSHVSE